MLQPIRTKFRKAFKGRIHGLATSGATLAFGQYGLKALEPERVTARQIEAARRALTRFMKRSGRVWIRVYPDVPVSKLSLIHISEPTRQAEISYAVFCLKKKKKTNNS